MQRRYITVDVFTDRAFGGNPLAVVLDAGGLSTAQMQAIATEFNYSETTFVLPPRDAAHDAQVRIFTVRSEIPFAGHPNVGTAFVLATQAAKPPARLVFEEKAGLVPVEILTEQRRVVGAELTAPQPLSKLTPFSAGANGGLCVAVVGRYQNRPASAADRLGRLAVSGGGSRLARGVAAGEARGCRVRPRVPLRRLRRDLSLHTRYTAGEMPCDLQARMFHPGSAGLTEDPATGSATAAAAALLADLVQRTRRRIEAADRPGRRYGPAEPVADARSQAERRGRISACRRRLRADDGRHVSPGGRGVTASLCGATRFSILTPSRSSMISAIHCRWQCGDRARSRECRPGRISSPAPTARRVLPWPAASSDAPHRFCAAHRICRCARPRGPPSACRARADADRKCRARRARRRAGSWKSRAGATTATARTSTSSFTPACSSSSSTALAGVCS